MQLNLTEMDIVTIKIDILGQRAVEDVFSDWQVSELVTHLQLTRQIRIGRAAVLNPRTRRYVSLRPGQILSTVSDQIYFVDQTGPSDIDAWVDLSSVTEDSEVEGVDASETLSSISYGSVKSRRSARSTSGSSRRCLRIGSDTIFICEPQWTVGEVITNARRKYGLREGFIQCGSRRLDEHDSIGSSLHNKLTYVECNPDPIIEGDEAADDDDVDADDRGDLGLPPVPVERMDDADLICAYIRVVMRSGPRHSVRGLRGTLAGQLPNFSTGVGGAITRLGRRRVELLLTGAFNEVDMTRILKCVNIYDNQLQLNDIQRGEHLRSICERYNRGTVEINKASRRHYILYFIFNLLFGAF